MKKIFIANILIASFGIILYLFLLFYSPLEFGTGYKELENVILLAIPCILFLLFSFTTNNNKERKICMYFYLLSYLVVMFGFVFSNNRYSELTIQGIIPRDYNLIPFHSIIELLKSPLGYRFSLYNIIGNFLMLTPLSILLPMIHEKFKKTNIFLISITILCLFIESIQYITGLGSFDIDDFILNISGAIILFLLTKFSTISNFLENLFFKRKFSERICNFLSIILIVMFILVGTRRILFLVNDYYENKIDFSNLQCQSNERTYIGDVNNYHYYSKCNYGTTYITVGNLKYTIDDFIHSRYANNYIDKLPLEKKEIITNVILKEKNSKKTLLYYDNDLHDNYYVYGYEKIYIEKDDQVYDISEIIDYNHQNIAFIFSLTELSFLDYNKGYGIYSGDYYQILSCTNRWDTGNGNYYLLDINYKITDHSCSSFERIE